MNTNGFPVDEPPDKKESQEFPEKKDAVIENVVYILGAGFSHPLGLPLMSNFLEKSKDQYSREPRRFSHFEEMFRTFDEMHKSSHYFTSDLSNIEEILSILEMQESVRPRTRKSEFLTYLKDVIAYYTPEIEDAHGVGAGLTTVFGRSPWNRYVAFVSCIFGLGVVLIGNPNTVSNAQLRYAADGEGVKTTQYSIVTLNYDLVLEKALAQLNKSLGTRCLFSRSSQYVIELVDHKPSEMIYLSKLHGSVDFENIIPPTWNKNLSNEQTQFSWKNAYECIMNANHIRILGYSLPATDSYIKYLLRAAVIHSFNLKRIDVLCLDQKGDVKKRYDEFIPWKNYKFLSSKVETYLDKILEGYRGWEAKFGRMRLEYAHDSFFDPSP